MKTFLSIPLKLIFATVLTMAASCAGGKADNSDFPIIQNPPFIFGDVYYQDWVAGVKEGGSGTNVHITFSSFVEDVVIMDLYFRNKVVKAQNSPQNRNQYVGYFKNDAIPDLIMDIDPVKEAQNTPVMPFPFNLKDDEAVVSYLHKGEVKYAKVSNMRRKEMLAYPSTRPKGDN